jgi:hypothetical protein
MKVEKKKLKASNKEAERQKDISDSLTIPRKVMYPCAYELCYFSGEFFSAISKIAIFIWCMRIIGSTFACLLLFNYNFFINTFQGGGLPYAIEKSRETHYELNPAHKLGEAQGTDDAPLQTVQVRFVEMVRKKLQADRPTGSTAR